VPQKSSLRWLRVSRSILFLFFTAVIILSGTLYLQREQNITRADTYVRLNAMSHLRIEQIQLWRSDRIRDGKYFFLNQNITDKIARLVNIPGDTENKSSLNNVLSAFYEANEYFQIAIVDVHANVLAATPNDSNLEKAEVLDELATAFHDSDVVVHDFHLHGKNISLCVVVPKYEPSTGKPLAAILLQIDPYKYFYPSVLKFPVSSRTSEFLLVRRDDDSVLYLNELRHLAGTAVKMRLPLSDTNIPAVKAVLGNTENCEGIDYRGQKVLASLGKVPNSPWYLVTKIDVDEVNTSHKEVIYVLVLMFLLICAVGAVLALWLNYNQVIRLRQSIEFDKRQREMMDWNEMLFQQANDAIIIFDEDGKILRTNKRAEHFYGYSSEEFFGLDLNKLPADNSPITTRNLINTLITQNGFVSESIHVRRDGTNFAVEASGKEVDFGGKRNFQIIVRNIEERKRAETALRENEQRLRFALEVGEMGGWEINLTNHTASHTPMFDQIFGYETLMRNWTYEKFLEHVLPEDRESVDKRFHEAVETHSLWNFECRIMRCDNVVRWIFGRCQAQSNDKGKPRTLTGIIQDITDWKQAEEILLISENNYRRLFESAKDGILIVDAENGSIFDVNPFLVELLGYPKDNFVGKQLWEIGGFEDIVANKDNFIELKQKEYIRYEDLPLLTNDGRNITVEFISNVYSVGERKLIQCNIRDITRRRESELNNINLQQQLNQASKLESVGQLAGGVAHDFNNMLGAILGYSELVMRITEPDSQLYAYLDEIQKAAVRSANLTRQLLTFARKQTIMPKVLDLNDTVEGMLKMLRRLIGENINLTWTPDSNLWPVLMDPTQVDQILANLCVNARDAISGNGIIIIETHAVSVDVDFRISHPEFVHGDYVQLQLSDNGIGMDAEVTNKIFEPFFTTKEMGKGTGLGLSTVYGIVKQNRGFINVYSEPGRGTTFSIYIPRHVTKELPEREVKIVAPIARGTETILLVEDEPAILNLTTQMLETYGYRVLATLSPREAHRIAKEYLGEIDLLVTDVVMPEMNGRILSKLIKIQHPNLKFIFMSGYSADIIAQAGVLDEGINFIHKPFTTRDFVGKVRKVLDTE